MAYPGLETLFQNLGPTAASMAAGTQFGQAETAEKSAEGLRQQQIQEALLKNQLAQATQGYDIEKARLGNETTLAELPGKQATSKKAQLEASSKEATNASDIQKIISGNDVQVLTDKVSKLNRYTDILGNAAAQLENVPPVQRFATLGNMLKGMNIDINNPAFAGIIQQAQSVNPEKLPEILQKFQQNLIQRSAGYQSDLMKEQEKFKQVKEQGVTARDVANIYATSRENVAAAKNKGVATIEGLVGSGKLTAEKAAVALFGAAQFETDPDVKKKYEEMAQQYEQLAMNQRNAAAGGKVDIGAATNLPTQKLPPALKGAPTGPARKPLSDY